MPIYVKNKTNLDYDCIKYERPCTTIYVGVKHTTRLFVVVRMSMLIGEVLLHGYCSRIGVSLMQSPLFWGRSAWWVLCFWEWFTSRYSAGTSTLSFDKALIFLCSERHLVKNLDSVLLPTLRQLHCIALPYFYKFTLFGKRFNWHLSTLIQYFKHFYN